jgi:elongation factor G
MTTFSRTLPPALRAVDGVVMVADAIDGVKVQGEKVWQFVKQNDLPAIIVVNKMERDRADFDQALGMIGDMLEVKLVKPLQIPIGKGEEFNGVVDLLTGKAYTFAKDNSGKMESGDVPADLADEVEAARETMIEDIAEADDSLVERYLEGEELKPEELAAALAKGVREGIFCPVAVSAALFNIGSQPIMDLINQLLPSPAEAKPVTGVNPKTKEEEERPADPAGPLAALVFKTVTDPFAGQLSMVRIFSGTLKTDVQPLNPNRDAKERFGNILQMTGKNQQNLTEAGPGDLVAIPKLKETKSGDTLCDPANPIQLAPIEPLPASISYAIEAKEKGDEEKVFAGINKLLEEDPTLRLDRDPQTGEAILSGMGSVHIETTLERLKRKFGVEVNLKTPKVPFRETIKGSTRVQGRYKKQTGGRGQFGDTWLEISPAEEGEGYVFVDEIVGGAIPRQYIPAVEKGIERSLAGRRAGRLSHGGHQGAAGGRLLPPGGFIGNGLQGGRLPGLQKRRGGLQAHPVGADHEAHRHRARRIHGRRDGRHFGPPGPGAGHGFQGLPAGGQRPRCPCPRCSPISPN